MDEQFVYTQLDATNASSFRILELQPGKKEAPIICNLIHARLDAQPAYEAISYVWGSSERPIPIHCDGKRLYITENLKDALVRVRLPDRPRMVWADSVCIDQDNPDEKGHQVQFMGNIYSNASRVLICLGNDDEEHAQKAFSLIKDVSEMVAKTLTECEQTDDSFPYFAPDDPWFHDDRWPAYNCLLWRPWFDRGWALQEAALAQDAVVLWGEAECSWIPFMDTQIWIKYRGYTLHSQLTFPPKIHRVLHRTMGGHSMRLRPLTLGEYDTENLSVPEFMAATRALCLSNDVDRVFAFLAVINKISQTALHIKADYSKAPQSVYTDFAVAYLQATRDLNLLQWIQHTNESLELETPSWVPLWDIDQWKNVRDVVLAREQDPLAHFTLEVGSGPPRLTVQALLFDIIRFASSPLFLDTVEDVARLWHTIRHRNESADVYEFLQSLCLGYYVGEWKAWTLQLSAYGRRLLASSSPSNLGMNIFRIFMT